ncbi:MAG: UDP-N-acetylglucosamine 1-carboxyvinyltransferase [Clostridia bacterium]|nr:UDP-N-acetylglucosamine 1-carboxyvinyltransferase [Clostridia bacterium]
MSSFIINGGQRLHGKIEISGSKNAALPIIFATIVTKGISKIVGLPNISDVRVALDILKSMGATIHCDGEAVYIDTVMLEYREPSAELVCQIRASSYLLGACLSRFGRAHLSAFGGCNFERRPIDMHLAAAVSLGARCENGELTAKSLHGSDITFKKTSVGATVNAILMASGAQGKTKIYGYAREPHVFSLIEFLRGGGAAISFCNDYIEIEGRELSGSCATVIPDMIEAGTYAVISLITGSELEISGINRQDLSSFFNALVRGGATLVFSGDSVFPQGIIDEFLSVTTAPHPSFPTDLQPIMAPLLAAFCGGRLTESVWLSRFGYLSLLSGFGVKYELNGSSATIYPSDLHPATVEAPDLRGGAALLIAALKAEGESRIDSAQIINRGYENIVNKLRGIGAQIKEIQ